MRTSILLAVGLVALATFPLQVRARVIINEIAWMGTTNSHQDEWIELYNDGASEIDLNGWTLEAADGAPLIHLEGIISSGGFFLLERTDDNTVSTVSANQIYKGRLHNDGEALALKDPSGAVQDSLDARAGWPAGDNISKDTAQRFSSGWLTGSPTPGAPNTAGSSSQPSSGSGGGTSGSSSSESATGVQSGRSGSSGSSSGFGESSATDNGRAEKITAEIIAKTIVVVGAELILEARAYGLKGEPLSGARFIWNFGDGASKEGPKVLHVYSHPGRYWVVVSVASGELSASAKVVLDAQEANTEIVDVELGPGGYIEITNQNSFDLDISRWHLAAAMDTFALPHGTTILAGQRVKFGSGITGLQVKQGERVLLMYPQGGVAAEYVWPARAELASITSGVQIQTTHDDSTRLAVSRSANKHAEALPTAVALPLPQEAALSRQANQSATQPEIVAPAESTAPDQSPQYIAAVRDGLPGDKSGGVGVWLLALFGIIGLGAASTIVMRRQFVPASVREEQSGYIDNYEVLEDND